jgi:hypothetical protein
MIANNEVHNLNRVKNGFHHQADLNSVSHSVSHKRGYVLRLCEEHAELWMTEEETRFLIATYHDYRPDTERDSSSSKWHERFHFYRRIEKEMRKILQVGNLPLVVTGRRMDLYIYRRINTYPWLLELVESQPGQRATKYLDLVQKKIQWILSHLENFVAIGNASSRRARSSVG